MERMIMEEMENWYEHKDKGILCISGGPKVGKTGVVKEFCRLRSIKYIYLSARDNITADKVEMTELLIIDDINREAHMEAVKSAMAAYTYENVVLVGQIREDKMRKNIFTQENNIKYINMYPMNFSEFCLEVEKRYRYGRTELLKIYFITGGLPQCVSAFIRTGDLTFVREVQRDILEEICREFTEGARESRSKEEDIIRSMPYQVENVGFIFRKIHSNAREREYGQAVRNLEEHGVVYKIQRFPRTDAGKRTGFKLVLFDVGLLGMLCGIEERAVYAEERLLDKMIMTNYLLQESIGRNIRDVYEIYYWKKERAKAKLPIVLIGRQDGKSIVAVDIMPRADICSKSARSFLEEYPTTKVISISNPFRQQGVSWTMGVKNK